MHFENHQPNQPSKVVQLNSKRRNGHVMPRQPVIDLNAPGRLRTAHVLALCGLSHSTLCARKKIGQFPKEDGQDPRLYWNTSTIRDYLEK